ncbi:MAG: hypothetical protein JWP12_829 [Bacteroidetes bacterium]|nr:hypothetical protein [Bacteroidota bacterium]
MTTTDNDTSGRELVISRTLNAPRELVWKAWTSPEHLINWWGPTGFTNTFKEISIKPGGVWLFTMHGPDGTDYPNRIIFKEVVKPERLAYAHDSGEDNDPQLFNVVVTFEKAGDKTNLTMKSIFASVEALKLVVDQYGAIEGGNQTIDRLEAALKEM